MSEDADFKVPCRGCRVPRELSEFRLFRSSPDRLYMDFCRHCEQREGTVTLYRRFFAYATTEIADAVFTAERVREHKRTDEQKRLLVQPSSEAPATNEELVRRELARRELAKRRLVFFALMFYPDYKPTAVHHDICRRLERFVEAIERGESPRLMIAMPPRHGKSLLASDIFPSWVLGRHPEWAIIAASHTQSLPIEFSRNIRDRINDNEYRALFPKTALRKDSQAVDAWKLTEGGGYIAAGVGVAINGKGMTIGIADDLIKDALEAQSEKVRDNTYAWYQTVFRLRLAPAGGILLIGTRWHDNDVQGRELSAEEMLRKEGVPEAELEGWDVVSYPALATDNEYLTSDGKIFVNSTPPPDEPDARVLRKKDEALHPERYNRAALMKLKHRMSSQEWSALYQQNPTPDDGDFFKRSDFRYRRLTRDYWLTMRRFITFDFAISTRTSAKDYTVGGVFALGPNRDLYLLDVVRGRWKTQSIVQNIVQLVLKYQPEVFAGERGQIYEAVWPLVREALNKEDVYLSFDETLVPLTDKEVRARPLQGLTQVHKLIFSYDGEERPEIYTDVERELLRFPNGTNDDIVDMLAWGARLAQKMSPAFEPAPAKPKSWKDRVSGITGTSHMAS